jgi:hypothetical protein
LNNTPALTQIRSPPYDADESIVIAGDNMLTFHQKRELQKLIIEQNRILAGSSAPAEKSEAERIKREALSRLGIPPRQDQGIQQ